MTRAANLVPLALSVLALATLVIRTRLKHTLDLWLAVAMGAWIVEILLSALPHTPGIVTLSLTGAQVMELLEQSAANQAPADDMDGVGGLIQTDGLQWAADLRQPIGTRVGPVHMDGKPLDPAREYRTVTHAGLLGGLHRYRTFAAGRDIQRRDRSVGEAVVASFRTAGVIRAPSVGDVQLIRAGQL